MHSDTLIAKSIHVWNMVKNQSTAKESLKSKRHFYIKNNYTEDNDELSVICNCCAISLFAPSLFQPLIYQIPLQLN